ncbi:MAG: hypothetical protein HY429_02270 [Candidatus Levybacteria bacterium]|nr:hypothetical protein [Candidatus Levybacteria bacterium]
MKESVQEEEWDKKKIAAAAFALLVLLGVGAYYANTYIFKQTTPTVASIKKDVAGARSEVKLSLPQPKEMLQEKFEDIKEEVEKINIVEIASSSPQIQKVLNDIKSLENYPRNQAKEMCKKICDGI